MILLSKSAISPRVLFGAAVWLPAAVSSTNTWNKLPRTDDTIQALPYIRVPTPLLSYLGFFFWGGEFYGMA